MKIYLAGSIPKGDTESQTFHNWREHYQTVLAPIFDADFLIPKAGEVDETDAMLVLGKDSLSIKTADLIVANSEDRLGAGTAMELVIAKYFKKPVITVLPKDTYHRRSNVVFEGVTIEDWVHPFIKAFSDFVIEKIENVAEIKEEVFKISVKDITVIDQAVARREQSL